MRTLLSTTAKSLIRVAVVIWIMLSAACSGTSLSADPATVLETAGSDTAAGTEDAGSVQPAIAGLPMDEYVDPAVIAARRGNVVGSISLPADEPAAHSANAYLNSLDHTAVLLSSPGQPAWVVYSFSDILQADSPMTLTVTLDEPLWEGCSIGLTDYGRECWTWTEITASQSVNHMSIPSAQVIASPGGNAYAAVVASGGSIINITGISLQLDMQAPPPTGLQAGNSVSPTRISLTWDDPATTFEKFEYESIVIDRSVVPGTWEQIAELPGGTTAYDDIDGPGNRVPYGGTVGYRLRTVVDGQTGPPGLAVHGQRQLADVAGLIATDTSYPDKIKVSWYRVDEATGYEVEIKFDGLWQHVATLDSGNLYRYEHYRDSVEGIELEFGEEYIYRVRGIWQEPYYGDWAYEVGSRGLAEVTGINATDGNFPDKVVITWDPVPRTTGYQISFQRGSSPNRDLLDTVDGYATTEYEHTYQSPAGRECDLNVVYKYWVHGLFEDEAGPWTIANHDEGFRSVQPPAGVLASDGTSPDAINLSWTKTPGATAYKIYRDGVTPGHIVATLGDVDQWEDPVADYDPHSYRIRAIWQSNVSELSPAESGYRNLFRVHEATDIAGYQFSLAELDGRPAIAYVPGYQAGPLFLHAQTAEPASGADWQEHVINEQSGASQLSLAVLAGKPVIAHADKWRLSYSRATTSSPAGSEDWVTHVVFRDNPYSSFTDLVTVNGLPAICFQHSYAKYARALTAEPASESDWYICDLPVNTYFGSIVDYQGSPAITYGCNWMFGGLNSIGMAIGTIPAPVHPADWQNYQLGSGTNYSCAAVVDGRLAAAFPIDGGSMYYARALVDDPVSGAEWSVCQVDSCKRMSSKDFLTTIDGRPAMCYVDTSETGSVLKFAWATTPAPADTTEWEIRNVDTGSIYTSTITEVSGRPAIAYSTYSKLKYAYAQE